MSDTILEVTLWLCPVCNYWRSEQSTGKHQAPNPEDPNGRMLVHELVAVRFYNAAHHPDIRRSGAAEEDA